MQRGARFQDAHARSHRSNAVTTAASATPSRALSFAGRQRRARPACGRSGRLSRVRGGRCGRVVCSSCSQRRKELVTPGGAGGAQAWQAQRHRVCTLCSGLTTLSEDMDSPAAPAGEAPGQGISSRFSASIASSMSSASRSPRRARAAARLTAADRGGAGRSLGGDLAESPPRSSGDEGGASRSVSASGEEERAASAPSSPPHLPHDVKLGRASPGAARGGRVAPRPSAPGVAGRGGAALMRPAPPCAGLAARGRSKGGFPAEFFSHGPGEGARQRRGAPRGAAYTLARGQRRPHGRRRGGAERPRQPCESANGAACERRAWAEAPHA